MTGRTDSEALTVRADRTRNHLSELVDKLQHQITPAELVHQLVGFQDFGSGVAQTIAAQVKKNPLACILIAAGLGLLVFSDRQSSRSRRKSVAVKRARRASAKRRSRQKHAA
jgi:hypothetical protein